jgi:hypothetical protein
MRRIKSNRNDALGRMFRTREAFNRILFECYACGAQTTKGEFCGDDRFRCYDCFGFPRRGSRAKRAPPP